jgi:hypothetical protein
MIIELYKAKRPYKYEAYINGKEVSFGADGFEDFTTHGDEERKKNYLARHKPREDWTKRGIKTAGFWSRWLLWNKPSIEASIEDIEDRFNVKIIMR